MSPWPVDAEVEEVHTPRPGHADLAGLLKFGHSDVRNVLERASARETAARVAAGALAKELLRGLRRQRAQPRGPDRLGARSRARRPRRRGLRRRGRLAGSLPRPGCERGDGGRDRPPAEGEREPRRDLRGAGLRPGAGARLPHRAGRSAWTRAWPRRWSRSRPSRGSRWGRPGRSPAGPAPSRTTRSSGPRSGAGTGRPTAPAASRAGCRTASRCSCARALKPISTLTKPLRSVDTETKEPAEALRERTDSTVVPAAARGGRGDDRPGAGPLLPREVRRRPHRRRARRAGRLQGADRVATVEGQDAGRKRAGGPAAGDRLHRLHGRRQDGRRQRRARRGPGGDRGRRAARGRARDADRPVLRPSRGGGVPKPRVRRR